MSNKREQQREAEVSDRAQLQQVSNTVVDRTVSIEPCRSRQMSNTSPRV
ncbi:MAG TPA: hypothetical protein V6D10_10770 [Trichocoleus sp.]